MTRQRALHRSLLAATLLLPVIFTIPAPAQQAAIAESAQAGAVHGQPAAAETGWYFPAEKLPLATVLPPPPAPGSAAQQADLAAVQQAAAARTPETIAASQADAVISAYRFADVLGPEFKAETLPLATALFDHMSNDIRLATMDAKAAFNRPRPFVADPALTTVVKQPANASYPSGHTTFGFANAVVLAAMVPEKAREIFARAELYGQHRIIGGVHYPTDVEAGKIAGSIIGCAFLQSPRFQADFAAARAEVRQALNLPK